MDIEELLKKEHVILIVLGFFSAIFSLYTVRAYQVAQFARGINWNTGGPGSFLPWPSEPGHLMVITEMNSTDAFINQFIIETGLLAFISLLLWCGFFILIFRLAKSKT